MVSITNRVFPASGLLRVDETTPKAGIPFLNFSIRPLPLGEREGEDRCFCGAGLYAVLFRGALVYVGSFLGEKQEGTFGGDVVKARWLAHFGTLTCRGHKISVQDNVLDVLERDAQPSSLYMALAGGQPQVARKQGCEASVDRLRFVNRHWDFLSRATPQQALEPFDFIYCRLERVATLSDEAHRSRIEKAEVEAIGQAQPVANGKHRNRGLPSVALDAEATKRLLEFHLVRCLDA